jgi:hypothetical protein
MSSSVLCQNGPKAKAGWHISIANVAIITILVSVSGAFRVKEKRGVKLTFPRIQKMLSGSSAAGLTILQQAQ